MKAYLLFQDRDQDMQRALRPHEQELIRDLELETLFDSMALGDAFLFDVAQRVVLSSTQVDVETILHRQAILQDSIENHAVVRSIYDLAVETIGKEKKVFFGVFGRHPDTILYRSVEVLKMFVTALRQLRALADQRAGLFKSPGFRTLFAMLQSELNDDYLAEVDNHLKELQFSSGVLLSAELGEGNKGINYVLRRRPIPQGWLDRIFAPRPPAFTIVIDDRDHNGAKALSELREQGINQVANALAQSTDHILSFFRMLRVELGFYIGCLNLHQRLIQLGTPVCFPMPATPDQRICSFHELYDVSLALTLERKVVGNDTVADGDKLVIITGANQGGKSTFLRSVGLAQLMAQSGMFVPAVSFSSSICDGMFSHFRREEDATMTSGKLDEELRLMSDIVDNLTTHPMLLFNESFAATNDREGSEIARQIVSALLERSIRIFFVTHLYQFAHSYYRSRRDGVLFLRAERKEDGSRTFKLSEGEPLQTSFGEDLYRQVFADSDP